MHESMRNPFDARADADRHAIWQRLVAADSDAFATGDWSMIENDFDAGQFEGIRCGNSPDPDDWTIVFPRLADYRDAWLASSHQFRQKQFVGIEHREALYRRCRLSRIDVVGDRALAHKKFSGTLPLADGTTLCGSRQTLYRLHRRDGGDADDWKIVGFLGQLPLDEP